MKHSACLLRLIIYIALLYTNLHHTKAQHFLQGVVTEAGTGQAIEMATVQLLKKSDASIVSYTFTNAKGAFSMPLRQVSDSLQISVSLLGYKTWKQLVGDKRQWQIRLEEQAFALKEVEIRPGRVWGQRDTINYDISQFLTSKDQSIKDVIRKLPGLDVDDLGRISYNGKDISNFYVEGMDLTGGRYNQITNNLDAKAVESVQLLENHQPIRILQDKVKTENIALNLKLKPEFRDKWLLTLRGGLGSDKSSLLWEGSAHAMQLSRKSQSAYIYKGDNTGKDVTDEQFRFFDYSFGRLQEPDAPSYLSQPSIMAPLKKERLLFNDVHTLSANRLYRIGETAQLRINAGYTHDIRKQERGSETTYYQQHDSIHIAEESDTRIRSDQAELSLNLENNATDYYLSNRFKAIGNWDNSTSLFSGKQSVRQQIKTENWGLRNDFKNLWNPGEYTLEVRSLLRYNHSPSRLYVNDNKEAMHLNQLYTDNSLSLIRKQGSVNHQYTAGFTGQANNIKNGFSLYGIPSWQWKRSKWYANLSIPLIWTNFPQGELSRMAVNPSVSFNYKLNYAWRFSVSGSYREQYGDILNYQATPYQTDYRHIVWNSGKLPTLHIQQYSVYGEYKSTVKEFFASLSISHSRNGSDHMYEQLIEDGKVTIASRESDTDGYGWSLRGTISKGYYDWGLKASLAYLFSLNRAEQLSEGVRLPFKASYMQYEPKLSWSPSKHVEASYQSTIRYGGSTIGKDTRLSPLWNVVQKAEVSYELFPLEVNLSAEHYYNDVGSSKSVNAFFADSGIRLKHGNWQFEALASNLFDKQQYRYTEYNSLQSYTSWINIRGREFLLAARYKF
ncbi:hypothetical protein M2459_000367 [Parabacteroides sp. PF5-5]|uniref:carboxypeptidase regulatory-like domain-containing protein n=1 Tax=unclassified Parabacteroides TaxID=2649774 RepID=UPI00247454DF|nr:MULTISPECIES: carboxypeptidase regulatory-like domain-containing protein [unclassified Parabacteroides]MDH6306380.1 hypothetical protein [Parabacteroides sp. PH5-39]MDH6314652.1 hypothetical protein [Parabacteroides sp. PF5-13]MDH6321091.1 hypothetical protein [Parabacteroides sp. PH5-13]MDH6324823.1 hypothetical protein [Parabacteroides sp. PH5-8]MDH6325496.1 hypothetical protein [Parabacteroides sp. PH5-41]